MEILVAVAAGLATSFIAIILSRLLVSVKYFREAIEIMETYGGTEFTRDKRGLRKLRRIKPLIERARKRLAFLFFLHLAVFVMAYSLMIAIIYSVIPPENLLVYIPIAIPLISGRVEDSVFVTHAVFIGFIAFMQPSYLFMRVIKAARRAVSTEGKQI